MISHWEMLIRLAMGAILGGAIGFERDRHRRQAGLRDHLLVGLASSTFMVVSAHFYFFQHYGSAAGISADPSRIAASVVTGIGFLAGGAILKTGLSVQGLTTAAGLWLVAGIGLCAGAGMYREALAVTIMGLISLTLFRLLEEKGLDSQRREVTVKFLEAEIDLPGLLAKLATAGLEVKDFDFSRSQEAGGARIEFEALLPGAQGVPPLVKVLEDCPGVLSVKIRRP